MSKLIETYKDHRISECSWGFCVDGKKHFYSVEGARNYIDNIQEER